MSRLKVKTTYLVLEGSTISSSFYKNHTLIHDLKKTAERKGSIDRRRVNDITNNGER